MSNIKYIASAFKIVSDSFDPIRLKPNDNDLQRLNEVLVVTSLSFTLAGTNYGTADGVVLSDVVYKSNNGGRSLEVMRAAREDYDPAIAGLGK